MGGQAYDTGADGPVGGCPNIEGQPGVACMAPCPGDYRYQYGVFGMYPDVVRESPIRLPSGAAATPRVSVRSHQRRAQSMEY